MCARRHPAARTLCPSASLPLPQAGRTPAPCSAAGAPGIPSCPAAGAHHAEPKGQSPRGGPAVPEAGGPGAAAAVEAGAVVTGGNHLDGLLFLYSTERGGRGKKHGCERKTWTCPTPTGIELATRHVPWPGTSPAPFSLSVHGRRQPAGPALFSWWTHPPPRRRISVTKRILSIFVRDRL